MENTPSSLPGSPSRSLVSAVIPRSTTPRLLAAWGELGLSRIVVLPGRSSMLLRRHGLAAVLGGETTLAADAADTVRALVPAESEGAVMARAAESLGLERPGRGTLFSQDVSLLGAHPLCLDPAVGGSTECAAPIYGDLTGVVCIVQRSEGDQIARVVLDSGACVPVTTFGDGTGLRDKLGLLRITIPAEKEVVSAVVSTFDSEIIIEQLIQAGKLDQPGRGFLFTHPIRRGTVNNRITQDGGSGQAASLEQIVASIDHLRGGIEWRRRADGAGANSKRFFLSGVNLEILCNEGRASDLVEAAMAVGATGATIGKAKAPQRSGKSDAGPTPAREIATLMVPAERIPVIMESLSKAGAFDDSTYGQVFSHPVPKAFTYLPRAVKAAEPAKKAS